MEDKLRALDIKIVFAIGFGVAAFYYMFYFKSPDVDNVISGYEQELIMLDGEIKKLDREIAEGDQIQVNLENIKKEIKALSSYFEVKPNSKTIEQIISEEARATGISFTTLQAAPDQQYDSSAEGTEGLSAADYIRRNIIEADFTGTFIELMRFLSYLSRIDRIISLKQIQLSSENSSDAKPGAKNVKLSFKAEFETYDLIKDVNEETLAPVPEASESEEAE